MENRRLLKKYNQDECGAVRHYEKYRVYKKTQF